MPVSRCATQQKCTKLQMEKLLWEESVDSQSADVEWVECEHVNKTGLVAQLESQTNELKHQLDLLPNNHQSKQ